MSSERITALEADVAKLQWEISILQAKLKHLERHVIAPMNDHIRYLEKEYIPAMKAETETLRRLGTEMGKHLPDTDEANQVYLDFQAGGRQ